jgi:hypothetical protein
MILRRNIFIVVLIALALLLILRMLLPISFFNPIKMKLSKQIGVILQLDQPRNVDFTVTCVIPSIDFLEDAELTHKKLGPFGFKQDFFIDFYTQMKVNREGYYVFRLVSDDGFRLRIDRQKIGEFVFSRSLTTNEFLLYLQRGRHSFELNYFQGFGKMGLSAEYRLNGDLRFHKVGESSSSVCFE